MAEGNRARVFDDDDLRRVLTSRQPKRAALSLGAIIALAIDESDTAGRSSSGRVIASTQGTLPQALEKQLSAVVAFLHFASANATRSRAQGLRVGQQKERRQQEHADYGDLHLHVILESRFSGRTGACTRVARGGA
jgi:hypothetical protein